MCVCACVCACVCVCVCVCVCLILPRFLQIALRTVTNVEEAVQWLSYTYLIVRMRLNPQAYGIPYVVKETDPFMEEQRRKLVISAAMQLDKAKMIRFVENTNPQGLFPTDLGRTASYFYIKHASIEVSCGGLEVITAMAV